MEHYKLCHQSDYNGEQRLKKIYYLNVLWINDSNVIS